MGNFVSSARSGSAATAAGRLAAGAALLLAVAGTVGAGGVPGALMERAGVAADDPWTATAAADDPWTNVLADDPWTRGPVAHGDDPWT